MGLPDLIQHNFHWWLSDVTDDDGPAAEDERVTEPDPAPVVQLDHRIARAHLVTGLDQHHRTDRRVHRVGGTRAPGHTDLADLQASLDRLLALPDETVVHPGHTTPTTIGVERSGNPFVRYFRGEAASLDEPVTAWGEPATLLVWGPDYDGGHKALVRWADGAEDIVGGSKVERG